VVQFSRAVCHLKGLGLVVSVLCTLPKLVFCDRVVFHREQIVLQFLGLFAIAWFSILVATLQGLVLLVVLVVLLA
jgi:hypothetical protein